MSETNTADIEDIFPKYLGRVVYHTLSNTDSNPFRYGFLTTYIWKDKSSGSYSAFQSALDNTSINSLAIKIRKYDSNKWSDWKAISSNNNILNVRKQGKNEIVTDWIAGTTVLLFCSIIANSAYQQQQTYVYLLTGGDYNDGIEHLSKIPILTGTDSTLNITMSLSSDGSKSLKIIAYKDEKVHTNITLLKMLPTN